MTDKVQKIREDVEIVVNRRLNLLNGDYFDLNKEADGFTNEIMDIINPLQEEPVSEDLEEAAKRYSDNEDPICTCEECLLKSFKAGAKWQKEQFEKERLKHCDALTAEQAQIESDFVVQHLKKNNRTPTFIDAIEYGMMLEKEQMMAKAIDGYVIEDIEEGNGDFLLSADYLPKSMNLKDRQKSKSNRN